MLAVGAGPASASVVKQGKTLLSYSAAKGERNRLVVTVGATSITFTDAGAKPKRAKGDLGGCKVKKRRAVCKVDPMISLKIDLGDGDDSVRFNGSAATKLGGTDPTQAASAWELADSYAAAPGARTTIRGGSGNDTINGTNAVDAVDPGPGKDKVDVGSGNDRLVDKQDRLADILRGGDGVDTVDVQGSNAVTIDLDLELIVAGSEMTSLDSFERARGGASDDKLIGSPGADGLFGDGGDDAIDAGEGLDYLGGDLPGAEFGKAGSAGVDKLTGGPGDDVLDARDVGSAALTPTDELACGDGADTILARQDDRVDGSCEASAFGDFSARLEDQFVDPAALTTVQPLERGADGAPTYEVSCPATAAGVPNTAPCAGNVILGRAPVAGQSGQVELFGSAAFNLPAGTKAKVAVVLNGAGKAALAQPGAVAAVHVVGTGVTADFGWQQVLGA